MLIMYSKVWQDGIEALENAQEAVRDKETSHFYFDDFRISLKYHLNEKDNLSGVGALTYAPNGLLWSQSSIYCLELDKLGSYYYSIEQMLEEVKKSKAKNLTIFIDDKEFVRCVNLKKPYKQDAYNNVHNYVIDKLKKFPSYKILFRDTYPDSVKKRLEDESKTASRQPEFNHQGRWQNQHGIIYFNISNPSEDDKKDFAEQYARMFMNFFDNYMKEYEQDYGKEALNKLVADIKAKKIKSLPDVKRIKASKERYIKIKKYPKINKQILCQNCQTEMNLENCLMKYPEKQLRYYYRCSKCQATKTLNEKGRVITYGKYPNKKDEN